MHENWQTKKSIPRRINSSPPTFVIGFHGCDKAIADSVISQQSKHILPSKNKWDWLGHGIYFWEQNYQRALDWANYLISNPTMMPKGSPPIKTAAAIGAIINLGKCLNLLDGKSIGLVKQTYEMVKKVFEKAGTPLPKNTVKSHTLDCAVINAVNM